MLPEERHAVRIATKKLRYAAEFFTCLYPAKDSRAFMKLLTELQDNLGQINDIDVTERLIKRLAGHKPGSKVKEAIHILEGWNASSTIHNIAKIDITWQKLATIKPFWL